MTTPMGRAFATILAVFGEMEAAAISSRVRAARAHLVKEGRFAGGGISYGYMSAPNPDGAGRILVKDPERIQWLTEMVRLAQSDTTVNGIAAHLDREGAPPPRRSGGTAGFTWNRQTVQGLLRNPVLAGMMARNPGRKRTGKAADPFSVLRDDAGEPVIDESLAVITAGEFAALVAALDARGVPQARKAGDRQATSPFLSKVARCDDCGVYMCRGTNQKKPVLYCPQCRQTQGREALDDYLVRRLLRERGGEPLGTATVRDHWRIAGTDEDARRDVLLSQLGSLRIRRGRTGVRLDKSRILLCWREPARQAPDISAEAAALPEAPVSGAGNHRNPEGAPRRGAPTVPRSVTASATTRSWPRASCTCPSRCRPSPNAARPATWSGSSAACASSSPAARWTTAPTTPRSSRTCGGPARERGRRLAAGSLRPAVPPSALLPSGPAWAWSWAASPAWACSWECIWSPPRDP